MKVHRWPIDKSLTTGEDYLGNQLLAQNSSSLGYEEILAQYVYVTPKDVETIFSRIPNAEQTFYGRGIDLGGGVACISSTIASKPTVQFIVLG